MASSLTATAELLKCGSCDKNLQNPRVLPCLHRFCHKCIAELVSKHNSELQCPQCEYQIEISEDGVDGFPTDHLILSFQSKLEIDRRLREGSATGECGSCENSKELVAFCGTCDSMICKECLDFHSKKVMQNHKGVVNLRDVCQESSDVMDIIQKVSAIPKCPQHPQHDQYYVCFTCDSLPICLGCTVVKHKDHEYENIQEASQKIRENLKTKFEDIKDTHEEFIENKEQFTIDTEALLTFINNRQTNEENDQKITERKIENERKQAKEKLRTEFDIEVERLKQTLLQDEKKVDDQADETLSELKDGSDSVQKTLKEAETDYKNSLSEALKDAENLLKRYDVAQKTASMAISERSDWIVVRSASDVCNVLDELSEEMAEPFPELSPIPDVGTSRTSSIGEKFVKGPVTEDVESTNIVGVNFVKSTIIMVIDNRDVDGKIQIQFIKKSEARDKIYSIYNLPCDEESKFEEDIALSPIDFCIERLSHILIGLGDAVIILKTGWVEGTPVAVTQRKMYQIECAGGSKISSICAHNDHSSLRNHFMVAFSKVRSIHLYDSKCKLLRILNCSGCIKSMSQIACYDEIVAVLDRASKAVYLILSNALPPQIIETLKGPDSTEEWTPVKVCRSGRTFVVWKASKKYHGKAKILHYGSLGGVGSSCGDFDYSSAKRTILGIGINSSGYHTNFDLMYGNTTVQNFTS